MHTGQQHAVILFDGICNFCNDSVNFIIDHDKKGRFSFASLQSDVAKEVLAQYGQNNQNFNSVILVMNGRTYYKSSAALEIARQLDGFWPVFYIFRILPTFIRDFFYDIIAKNRYRWFGKRESCRFPEPAVRERFLEGVS